jgi:hypothetical protein
MRSVAAQAINPQTAVSLVHDLVTQGVRGMLFPVMAGAAKLDDRLIPEITEVGRVRSMAGHAVPFLYRFMLGR